MLLLSIFGCVSLTACHPALLSPLLVVPYGLVSGGGLSAALLFDFATEWKVHAIVAFGLFWLLLIPTVHKRFVSDRTLGDVGSAYSHGLLDAGFSALVVALLIAAGGSLERAASVPFVLYGAAFSFVLFFVLYAGYYQIENERRALIRDANANYPEIVQVDPYIPKMRYRTAPDADGGLVLIVGDSDRWNNATDLRQAPPSARMRACLERLHAGYWIHYLAFPLAPLFGGLALRSELLRPLPTVSADLVALLAFLAGSISTQIVLGAASLSAALTVEPTFEMAQKELSKSVEFASRVRTLVLHDRLHDFLIATSLALTAITALDWIDSLVTLIFGGIALAVLILFLLVPFAAGQRATAMTVAVNCASPAGVTEVELRAKLQRSAPLSPHSWPIGVIAPALAAQGLLPTIAIELGKRSLGTD